jgi:hypothetical protein
VGTYGVDMSKDKPEPSVEKGVSFSWHDEVLHQRAYVVDADGTMASPTENAERIETLERKLQLVTKQTNQIANALVKLQKAWTEAFVATPIEADPPSKPSATTEAELSNSDDPAE